MDLMQLRYFQEVAKTGNITRAARELHVTQPNLSKSIARLEDELQVPLFSHRKGRIELNDYGRMFLSSVELAFSQLDTGVQSIRRMYDVDQNILSLASNIPAFLPDAIPQFIEKHPDIGIRQIDANTDQIVDKLLDRSLTLGISFEEIEHDQIMFDKLGEKEYVLAVNKKNPLSEQNRISFKNLAGEEFICDLTRLGLEHLRKICDENGFTPKISFEVESSALLYQLLVDNRGVAIIPIGMGCEVLSKHTDHNLKLIRIKEKLPPVIIGVAYHKNYGMTKAAELFVEHLKEFLTKEEEVIRQMGFEA
jgi:DNA-binding transcriptional LysR family regulator